MSEEYFEQYSSSYINRRDLSEQKRSNGKGKWGPRACTTWSPTICNELTTFFTKCSYPYRLIEEIPLKEPLRSEVRRFFLSLDAYIESPNPVIPEKSILFGACNKDYAEYLKRVKRKSFQTSWHVELFSKPEWWDDVPAYTISEIGDIFNFAYLIFFEGEVDDYKWGEIDVKINPDTLKIFEETLFSLLPPENEIEHIKKEEILLDISSSSSLDGDKHRPQWKVKPDRLYFNKVRQPCDRCVIQVSPNNYRDAHILDPADVNSIGWMDKQVMMILREMDDHIHLVDKDEATRRCRKLIKYPHFLQRDFRKEGITKPHEIACSVIRVLQKAFPKIDAFKDMENFYGTYPLTVDGEVKYMKRGHGLGLANGITTLMNLTLHCMTVDRIRGMFPDIKSDCLCLNDDFVAGFEDDSVVDEYWDEEGQIFEELSIIRADDKSFRSYGCYVIAERYFSNLGEDKKVSYQLRELLLPLAGYNITHAKEQFISVQSVISSDLMDRYLGEIISYWGYEFYPSEAQTPYKIGGWLNLRIEKVDFTLVEIEHLELKSYHYRGFEAVKVSPIIPKGGTMYECPFRKLYPFVTLDDDIAEAVNYLPKDQAEWKFGRIFSNLNKFTAYWDNLYKRRQKAFKKDICMNYIDLLKSIVSTYRKTQFYPNNDMIKTYHNWNFLSARIKDLYLDANPVFSALAYNKQIEYGFSEKFSLAFARPDEDFSLKRGLYSREVERSLKTNTLSLFFVGTDDSIMWPSDGYDPSEDYLNPIAVGKSTTASGFARGYPELLPEFRSPLIEEKKKVFGRFLTLEEMEYFTRTKIPRSTIKYYVEHLANLDDLKDLIDSFRDEILDAIICSESFIDPEGDEDEAPNLYHDSDRNNLSDPDENYITWDSLTNPENTKFWNYNQHSKERYKFDSQHTADTFSELSILVLYATYPGLKDRDELIKEFDQLRVTNAILHTIASNIGISQLIEATHVESSLDDDWGCDLFGE